MAIGKLISAGLTDETRADMSARAIARWMDPGFRTKMITEMNRPQAKARHRAGTILAMNRPEERVARSERAKAGKYHLNLHTPEARERGKAAMDAAASCTFKKPHIQYVSIAGREFWFRSRWERAFAICIEELGCSFSYEPERIRLSNGDTYTPDFLVETPFGPCFVEIHRVEKPMPHDMKKIARIRLAETDIPKLVGVPFFVYGETAMTEFIRTAKIISRTTRPELR